MVIIEEVARNVEYFFYLFKLSGYKQLICNNTLQIQFTVENKQVSTNTTLCHILNSFKHWQRIQVQKNIFFVEKKSNPTVVIHNCDIVTSLIFPP